VPFFAPRQGEEDAKVRKEAKSRRRNVGRVSHRNQLTVTIVSDSVNAVRVNSNNTALYTPDAAITGTSGRAVTGSASVAGMHF
jgi:hypothetical protein